MTIDNSGASVIPYVPNRPPAAPQPEGSDVDEIMQDPRPERPSQVEVSETLGRRILVHASEAGTVVAEQLVAQREVTVSSPRSSHASRKSEKFEQSKPLSTALPAQSATLRRRPSRQRQPRL